MRDIYIYISLEKHKKILRKFQPAFREIAKKTEPRGKKWFSYKKNVYQANIKNMDEKEVYTLFRTNAG